MTDNITITFTKHEADVLDALLRDVELLADNNAIVEDIPVLGHICNNITMAREKISTALEVSGEQFTVEYFDGERWRWVSDKARFWERRKFDSESEANALMIAAFKQDAPHWFEYRILKA